MRREQDFALVRRALKFLDHSEGSIRDLALKAEAACDRIERFVLEVEVNGMKDPKEATASFTRSRKA